MKTNDVPYIKNPHELVGKEVKYVAEFVGVYSHVNELYQFVGHMCTVNEYDAIRRAFDVTCEGDDMWLVPPNIETEDVHRTDWREFNVGDICVSTLCAEWYDGLFCRFNPTLYGVELEDYEGPNMLCNSSRKKLWDVEIVDIIVKKEDANDVVMVCDSEYGEVVIPYTELHKARNIRYSKRKLVYEFKKWQEIYI